MTAIGLGVPVHRLRVMCFMVSSFATATFVSVAGEIGFVGLIVLHLARSNVGPLHGLLVRTAALVGAILLTASDTLSRFLPALQELPVGIVTTSLGAGFVFALLLGTRKREPDVIARTFQYIIFDFIN